MRRWLTLALAVVAGCGFQPAQAVGGDAARGSGDATGGDAGDCYGGGLLTVCFLAPPTGALELDAPQRIDTDTDTRCLDKPQIGGPDVCVIGAQRIEIDAPIAAIGMHPLVLVATDTLAVGPTGGVDVSSTAPGSGAGANTGPCGAPVAAGSDTSGGGGGAGGSFGDRGGDGGIGNYASGRAATDEGLGGSAAAAPTVAVVRGGCAGDGGGAGNSAGHPGVGGVGGGALYLIAGSQISIAGTLAAGGGGGTGGSHDAGAGGGGAGGLLGLDAPMVVVSGTLAANGGAGGQGGSSGGTGMTGGDGTASTSASDAAPGGNGGAGGDGGDGALGSATAGEAGDPDSDGGGGGGGSVGVTWLHGTLTGSGQFSPAVRHE